MDDFKESVKRGFAACKADIESLNNENTNLKSKINSLEVNNSKLKSELSDIKSELKNISELLKSMNSKQQEVKEEVVAIAKPKTVVNKSDPYEALLAFKAKSNKRDMLKNKIVSMVNDNGINLSELKFMFVEHYRYCSKATFYNYLKELELERVIKIERENSKNFVYLYTMKKEI